MSKPISDPLVSKTMIETKQPNYTDIQVTEMTELYEKHPCRDTVNSIAKSLGKSERSVIAKLSNLKVYIAPKRTTKSGTPIIKKETLVDAISKRLEVDMPSLVKANKQDLEKLTEALDAWLGKENT